MKKQVLFSAALVAAMSASAQTGEITSNRGENWLSQSGDWGLTFGADPLLRYAGNLFNGNQSNAAPTLNSFFSSNANEGLMIGGKKLVDANTAYRLKMRIGFGSDKATELVADLAATPDPKGKENVTKEGYMAIDLGAGIEKRVGSTRLVGIYGAEVGVGFGSSKTTYEYGNTLENTGSRITEEKNPGTLRIGLNAFAGVEYFVAPKISLSGEYAWGLNMTSSGMSEVSWDRATGDNGPTSTEGTIGDGQADKSSSFSIDTQLRGNLGINFYFQ
ncbi:MAG: hypothetical protein KF797_14845 [Flavobacteriales bacterium]|nr:hypothetical protein [Flavobacteriales bacterium]